MEKQKQVLELIYWRDPKKSGIAFGLTLALLICLATCSIVSVVAYGGLALLAVSVGLRAALMASEKLGKDVPVVKQAQDYIHTTSTNIPSERVHEQVDIFVEHINHLLDTLRRLLLLEDMMETAKFGALLWALTYVGAWFSGMTLMMLTVIGAFTIPKFYEVYKEPIDQNLGIATGYVKQITDQVGEKLPFLKKKQQ